MTNKKYVMFDLDDEKLALLTDVLSNKTSKKILDYLAEKEASETQIASDLGLAANTVNYNVKKLVETGLIESTKGWFWSVKGKKVFKYKVANKKIIISPKTKNNIKSVLSSILLVFGGAFFVKIISEKYLASQSVSNIANQGDLFLKSQEASIGLMDSASENITNTALYAQEAAIEGARQISSSGIASGNYFWIAFLVGGLFAIVSFIVLSKFFES